MKRRVVEITWVDARSKGGWSEPARYEKDTVSICRSVGYVLSRDQERTVLIQSESDSTGNVSDAIAIPARCIKRVKRLK